MTTPEWVTSQVRALADKYRHELAEYEAASARRDHLGVHVTRRRCAAEALANAVLASVSADRSTEPVYLHTWGSRRHIASPVQPASTEADPPWRRRYLDALCGQLGETTEVYFKNGVHTDRRRRTILARPICKRCEALS